VDVAEAFKHGFALLDTNILSALAQAKHSSNFGKILDLLYKQQCEIILLNSTKFEFVGYCNNNADYTKLNNWVNQFTILPINGEDIKIASFLSSAYKFRSHEISPKQISFCDCLNAAQLIKYGGRLLLVTSDIHDYPLFVFDIERTIVIDDNGKAVFVGIITYNEGKWLDLRQKFKESQRN